MTRETEPLSFDSAKFIRYLMRNLTYLLALVPSSSPLPAALCVQALHTLSFALHTPAAWSKTRALLLALAPKLEQAGLRDEWIPYLQKGVVQAATLGDNGAAAELHLHLGYLWQLRNKYQAAHDCFAAAAATFAALDDRENQARALNRLAFLARLHSPVGDPVALAQQALTCLPPAHPERAASYVALGWYAYDRRDWPAAATYFAQALAIAQQQNNERQLARRLRDLAAAWQMQGQTSAALAAYAEAIDRFAAIDDAYDQAVAQMNLGVVHLALSDAQTALACFTPVEAVFLRVQDQLHLAMLYNNCGIALRLLGRWPEAEQAFLRSLGLNEQVDNRLELLNVTDELALTYLQQGKVEPALACLRQARDLLPQITGHPAYPYWHEKITAHWQVALTTATDTPGA